MSIKKLENMLKRLEKTESDGKRLTGGGISDFSGVQGGILTGGKKKKGKAPATCSACGGRLMGGGISDFSGVQGGILTGGGISDFSGVQGGKCEAGVLTGGKYKKGAKANPPQLSAWREHLALFRAAHPNMSLKEAMKASSATYKKK